MKRKLVKILDLCVGGALLIGALSAVGITFGVSHAQYSEYEKQYNLELAELEKEKPSLPKQVFIDNDYVTYDINKEYIESTKSNYPNIKTIRASEASFSVNNPENNNVKYEVYDETTSLGKSIGSFDVSGGGTLTFNINTTTFGDADIDIVMASAHWSSEISGNTTTNSISQYIDIKIDELLVDAKSIDLICSDKDDWFEFYHVILKDLHLKKGKNTLTISTIIPDEGNPVMPNISHVHVLTEATLAKELVVNGDEMMLVRQINGVFLSLTGACNGYDASELMMDLCRDGEYESVIPHNAISILIRDGYFQIKIYCDALPKTKLFSHFFLDGNPYNTGRVQGDIMSVSFFNKYKDNWDNPAVIQTLGDYTLLCINSQMVLEAK